MAKHAKGKRDFKANISFALLFGVVGFTVALLFWYLTTGRFDLAFPGVIGIGFFAGGLLGSMLRNLYLAGEQRKVNVILFTVILLLLISQASGKLILGTFLVLACVFVGYSMLSSRWRPSKGK